MKTKPYPEAISSEAITNIVDMWEAYKVCVKQGKNPNNYPWKFPGRDEHRDYLLELGLIKRHGPKGNCKCGAFLLSRTGQTKARRLNKLGFHSTIRTKAEAALGRRK